MIIGLLLLCTVIIAFFILPSILSGENDQINAVHVEPVVDLTPVPVVIKVSIHSSHRLLDKRGSGGYRLLIFIFICSKQNLR